MFLFKSILLVIGEDSGNSKIIPAAVDLAAVHGASLTAVFIAGNDYECMLGDEWISDSGTLNRFFSYMEGERAGKTAHVLDEVTEKCQELGLQVTVTQKTGVPARAVISLYEELGPFDLVVTNKSLLTGGDGGAKKTMDRLMRGLVCPVLIYPEQRGV